MQQIDRNREREAALDGRMADRSTRRATASAVADEGLNASFSSLSTQRAAVFIDGSNWYHGLRGIGVRSSRLHYPAVARKLACDRSVCAVRYYVGRVATPIATAAAQGRFLETLRQQGVRVSLGRMQRNPMSRRAAEDRSRLARACAGREHEIPPDLMQTIDAFCHSRPSEYREKQVDTRIAVDLVDLAHRDRYDVAYLLSADADFIPAVEVVRRLGKEVFAVATFRGDELKEAVTGFVKVSVDWFEGLYV